MKKKMKMLCLHFAYYVLSMLVYIGFLYGYAKLFHTSDLGAAILLTYGLLFLATPILVVLVMRFSLLKWYVDPLAALEVPLFLYIGMIINQMNRSGVQFYDAFLTINESLSADGGSGWFYLIGLFVLGLIASFSLARIRGESICYRLIFKISVLHRRKKDEKDA